MGKIIKQYTISNGALEINDKIYRLAIQGYRGLKFKLGANSTYNIMCTPYNVFELTETDLNGNYLAGLTIMPDESQSANNLVIIDLLTDE